MSTRDEIESFEGRVVTHGNLLKDFLIFLAIATVLLLLMPRQNKHTPPVDHTAQIIQHLPDSMGKINAKVTETGAEGKSGVKHIQFFDELSSESGTLRWEVDLTAAFQNGESGYTCYDATSTFVSYNSTFFESARDIAIDGDTVTYTFVIGKRFFWIPTTKETYTFTFSCAPDGTLN